jgi:hypothetical protein
MLSTNLSKIRINKVNATKFDLMNVEKQFEDLLNSKL